jgi:hypothetical protein
MTMLTGKYCCALVTQALLLNPFCAKGMPEYCCCCDKFIWPITPLKDCEVT